MDAIGGIVSNILTSVLGWFNGVWDANENYVIGLVVCVVIGILFLSSTRPRKLNLPVVAYVLWSIAATLLALLLNFSAVDATLVGLVTATVFAIVMSTDKFQSDRKAFGFIWGLASLVLIISVFSVSSLNPAGGYLPSAFIAIQDVAVNLWSNVKWST